MKIVSEMTSLEIVCLLEASAINEAYNYGEELSDDYKNKINELKQEVINQQSTIDKIKEVCGSIYIYDFIELDDAVSKIEKILGVE